MASPQQLAFAKHLELRHKLDYVVYILLSFLMLALLVVAKKAGHTTLSYFASVAALFAGGYACAFVWKFNALAIEINAAELVLHHEQQNAAQHGAAPYES